MELELAVNGMRVVHYD